MRAAAALAAAALMIGQGAHGVAAQRRVRADPLLALETWISAIESHAPAADDAAIAAMLTLDADDLEDALAPMVAVLLRHLGRHQGARLDPLFRPYAGRRFSETQGEILQRAANRISARGFDRFLKRAAILHTDIALAEPASHSTTAHGWTQIVEDGLRIRVEGRTLNWMLGRAFLHVLPAAETDADVRLWYQAVATHLWSTRMFMEALPHLARGLQIFPRDAELCFVLGLMHESQAGPHIQAVIQNSRAAISLSQPALHRIIVQTAGPENAQAREAFRKALTADPEHAEARIRLARVLSIEGQDERALAELRTAAAKTGHRTLRYFAHLFEGRASERLGRTQDAVAGYEAAARLFPGAQSPLLALSQLALQAGDRGRARAMLASLSSTRPQDTDPWWTYHEERQPHRDVLMQRVYAAFARAIQ